LLLHQPHNQETQSGSTHTPSAGPQLRPDRLRDSSESRTGGSPCPHRGSQKSSGLFAGAHTGASGLFAEGDRAAMDCSQGLTGELPHSSPLLAARLCAPHKCSQGCCGLLAGADTGGRLTSHRGSQELTGRIPSPRTGSQRTYRPLTRAHVEDSGMLARDHGGCFEFLTGAHRKARDSLQRLTEGGFRNLNRGSQRSSGPLTGATQRATGSSEGCTEKGPVSS
jgi:hypothetical protein